MSNTNVASRDGVVRRPDTQALIYRVALALVIVGGLNWGLVGLFDFDLVAAIFGPMTAVTRIVYILVGISAVLAVGCFSRLGKRAP
jgi:uncharacterized membrane protein YuzA (DUF378 family)